MLAAEQHSLIGWFLSLSPAYPEEQASTEIEDISLVLLPQVNIKFARLTVVI